MWSHQNLHAECSMFPCMVNELLDALEAAEARLAGFHAQAMGIMETVKASDDSALLWELVHDLCMVEAP